MVLVSPNLLQIYGQPSTDNMQYWKQFKVTWNSISGISGFCFQSYNLGNYILASSSICPILPYTLKEMQLKADQ